MEIIGVNPYVRVTATQAAQLRPNWRKPMPVLVQINDHLHEPWHINMMPMGNGDFYLYLHGNVRKVSQTAVGDQVNVSIAFDESYRPGPQPLPDWFEAKLAQHPKALQQWEQLIPSRQKEVVRYLIALKGEAARERNLARVIHVLNGNKDHFMGRDWEGGQ